MGYFLHTDIARLVYGYLKDEGCSAAAQTFLETSPNMKEPLMFFLNGRKFITKVEGLTLVEILEILAEVKLFVMSAECNQQSGQEEMLRQLRCILRLSNDEEAPKFVFIQIPLPLNYKRKTPRKSKPVEINSPLKSKPCHESSRVDSGASASPSSNHPHALQVLLENKALHEKLAENINKVVANKSDVDSLEKILEKKMVETIVSNTEQDPIFQEMLEELVGPASTSDAPENMENDGVSSKSSHKDRSEGILDPPMSPAVTSSETNSTSSGHSGWQGVSCSAASSFEQPLRPSTPNSAAPQPTAEPSTASSALGACESCLQSSASSSMKDSPLVSTYLGSLVTPKVVVGTTFSGTALKYLPLCPHRLPTPPPQPPKKPQPCRIVPPPIFPASPQSRSTIRILASNPQTVMSSGIPVLPPNTQIQKPFVNTTLTEPLKSSVVSQPGNLLCSPSALGNTLGVIRPIISVNAAATGDTSLPVMKMGVRTRGGKARTYVGQKKVVQTITPSPNYSQVEPIPDLNQRASGEILRSPSGSPEKAKSGTISSIAPDTNDGIDSSAVDNPETGSGQSAAAADNGHEPRLDQPVSEDSKREGSKPEEEVENLGEKAIESEAVTAAPEMSQPSQKIDHELPQSHSETSSSSTNLPCRSDATPLQGSETGVKLRKRLSLSTPRRGSHVRTLEFKTPPKSSAGPRKSLSSPKSKGPEMRRPEMEKMLESIKKSELFKSPLKKEKKSWDEDLRQYTTEEDIPTSVGLKRKYIPKRTGRASKGKCTTKNAKDDPVESSNDIALKSVQESSDKPGTVPTSVRLKRKNTPKRTGRASKGKCTKNVKDDPVESSNDIALKSVQESSDKPETDPKHPDTLVKQDSDEDLVSRIQRDVLDVIDEEDLADLSSASLCLNKVSDSVESPKSSSQLVKSPLQSPGTSSVLEIGDIGLPASTIRRLYRRTTSVDESSCTLDSPLSKASVNLMSSPKKSLVDAVKILYGSPDKEKSHTPQQQIRETAETPPPKMDSPKVRTLGSVSLEATLIRECRRIESEGVETARETSNSEPDPNELNPGSLQTFGSEQNSTVDKPESSLAPHFPLPPGITPFKTPAKSVLSAPVEMTPLSKIINEETRLGKCSLLTPTIPPTPDYVESKNPPEDVVSPTNAQNENTPQPEVSQTPKPPTPPKSKTPKKTPSKTPVVKLRRKAPQGAAKTRKKKADSKKLTDTDILIARCLETAKAAVYGSKPSGSQSSSNTVPKTKTPKRKRAPQKPVAEPTKEPNTETSLKHFGEIIERFEKSLDCSSSSEDIDSDGLEVTPKTPIQKPKTSKTRTPKGKSNAKKPAAAAKKRKVVLQKTLPEVISCAKPKKKSALTVVGNSGSEMKNTKVVDLDENEGCVRDIGSDSNGPHQAQELSFHQSSLPCKMKETKIKGAPPHNGLVISQEVVSIQSPKLLPGSSCTTTSQNPNIKRSSRHIDTLRGYVQKIPIDNDGVPGTISILPSPMFTLFEFPAPVTIPVGSPTKVGKPLKLSNDNEGLEEQVVAERSKRRRRSRSCSSSDDERTYRKRRRIERCWIERRTPVYKRSNGGQRWARGYRPSFMRCHSHDRRHWNPRYSSSDDDRGRRSHSKSPDRSASKGLKTRDSKESKDGRDTGRVSRDRSIDRSQRDRYRNWNLRDRFKDRNPRDWSQNARSQWHKDSKETIHWPKHRIESARRDPRRTPSRYREPSKDKFSRRAVRRQALLDQTSSQHQDGHSDAKQTPQSENRLETCTTSEDTLVKEVKPIRLPSEELEEGEISDESLSTVFQFSKNNPSSSGSVSARLSSPVASESRQNLLKNVNVDKFLSLLHGDAKSLSNKEDEQKC